MGRLGQYYSSRKTWFERSSPRWDCAIQFHQRKEALRKLTEFVWKQLRSHAIVACLLRRRLELRLVKKIISICFRLAWDPFWQQHRHLNSMLSFYRASQSKALVALASGFSSRMVHSGSNFTPEYLEELEGLYKYTRGRWLYNEREREYLVYALYLTA